MPTRRQQTQTVKQLLSAAQQRWEVVQTGLFCNTVIITAFENQSGKEITATDPTGPFLPSHSLHSQPTSAPRDT